MPITVRGLAAVETAAGRAKPPGGKRFPVGFLSMWRGEMYPAGENLGSGLCGSGCY
jgi:hypothetical protein